MEAATAAKPHFLMNATNDTLILADVGDRGLSFPGKDKNGEWEGFDKPVKLVSDEQYQNSMDIQQAIAQNRIREITREQMQSMIQEVKVPVDQTGAEFEGNLTGDDITPDEFLSPEELAERKARDAAEAKRLASVKADPGEGIGDVVPNREGQILEES